MVEIIPAIMTESDEEFVRQIHILERAGVKRVHLDIADGIFVPRHTVSGYEQLRRINTDIVFDVHFMVHKPEKYCAQWCDLPQASRFLVHVEATREFAGISEKVRAHDKKLGAVINPETHLRKLEEVLDGVDLVQFMSVHPGAQGRGFLPGVLDQVTEFHAAHPNVPLMMDGGVTPQTAPLCAHAGATHLVSGSYILRAADPARALRELEAAVRQ